MNMGPLEGSMSKEKFSRAGGKGKNMGQSGFCLASDASLAAQKNKAGSMLALCLGALLCIPQSAMALKEDSSKPINISANGGVYSREKMETSFTGNVEISQGSLSIHADKLTIKFVKGKGNGKNALKPKAKETAQSQTDGGEVSDNAASNLAEADGGELSARESVEKFFDEATQSRRDADGQRANGGIFIATGSPVRFSQLFIEDGKTRKLEASSAKIEYNSITGVLKMIGSAKLKSHGDVITGDTIEYNVSTQTYKVMSGAKKRMSVVLMPKSDLLN